MTATSSDPATTPPPPGPESIRGNGPWQPAREPYVPITLTWAVVVSAIVASLVGGVAFQQPASNTLGMSLFGIALAIALWATGKVRGRHGVSFLVAAVVFCLFLSIRSDPRLIAFDALAALFLLLAAGVFGRGANPWDVGPTGLMLTLLTAVASWFGLAVALPQDLSARSRQLSSSRIGLVKSFEAIVRGLVVAVPLVFVLGFLLAQADVVFASFFDLSSLGLGGIGIHLFFTLLASTLVMVVLRPAYKPNAEVTERTPWVAGSVEALVVLVCVDVLFAVFAIAQFVGLAGGGEAAMAEAGMTYSEYARQGFFQLLWVAGLTLVVLMGIRALTESVSEHRKARLWLSQLAAVLTLGIVVVAITRISLYISSHGLTPLRFYSSVFSVWIGFAFVVVMVRLAGYKNETAWLAPVLLTSGIVILFVLNLINPEARMVDVDVVNHPQGTITLIDKLSADGVAVAVERLDELPPEARDRVVIEICDRQLDFVERRGLGYNRAENAAANAVSELCR